MEVVILGVFAVLSILSILTLMRSASKENINGVCDIECKDCTEKDWCILRYKGQEERDGRKD